MGIAPQRKTGKVETGDDNDWYERTRENSGGAIKSQKHSDFVKTH
jgi:hypothetical protein